MRTSVASTPGPQLPSMAVAATNAAAAAPRVALRTRESILLTGLCRHRPSATWAAGKAHPPALTIEPSVLPPGCGVQLDKTYVSPAASSTSRSSQ